MNHFKINIDPGIEYILDWKDQNGGYKIEHYLPQGKIVLNKVVTGCGITSWCLKNNDHTILVSPRVRLCQNKCQQLNKEKCHCYYFSRDRNNKAKKLRASQH